MNLAHIRDNLQGFAFKRLFVEDLGWSLPAVALTDVATIDDIDYDICHVAQLSGVVVAEVSAPDGRIPDDVTCLRVQRAFGLLHHENLLIFVDANRSQSLWYWVKREAGKNYPRKHEYVKGQPGDLFIGKLSSMVVELGDLDAKGDIPITDVLKRLKTALDVERVTKKFYNEYQHQHIAFVELIKGIGDEQDRKWYASVLLNRLMFIYFLQGKGFIDGGDHRYLQRKLEESRGRGADRFYAEFLDKLFFEGFAKPEAERSSDARAMLGTVRYLNGGLFLQHRLEWKYPTIDVPDTAFENLFSLFESYSWHLNDTPGAADNEINPDVLGYIFEKYINQKQFGAYYTRPEITEYLCEHTIHDIVLEQVNTPGIPGAVAPRAFKSIHELIFNLDARLCRRLLDEVLPSLSLLDPACGSGAFLVAAMKTMFNLYSAVVGKIEFLNDKWLDRWLRLAKADHRSIHYYLKKRIITDNLFGVDIMEEATEIARLRLFLALVASAQSIDDIEPLPNIDFNILAGNSLVGLMRVDEDQYNAAYEGNLFNESYHTLVAEKNRLVGSYRDAATYADDLRSIRDAIDAARAKALPTLDDMLMVEFNKLGAKVEEQTWDAAKKAVGKPKKRAVMIDDIRKLEPFHWGYEFDEIINDRGGFDAVITNPPWEIFKPNAKEFFEEYSDIVTRKTMTIKDFEKEQASLLKDADLRDAWLEYRGRFPHVSAYYRSAKQFENQISIVNGKKAGTDINLYKLFVEQCYNLLRDGGRCGLIVPSGLYNDLGAKSLRKVLFERGILTSIYGLSNERGLFDGVHHDQKFCLVRWRKGGVTEEFKVRFRIAVSEAVSPDELSTFLSDESDAIMLRVAQIAALAPDSLAIIDVRTSVDLNVIEKLSHQPPLRSQFRHWQLVLCNEFHMTGDSDLYHVVSGPGMLPLTEGKMIHQYDHAFAEPKYWLSERDARLRLLEKRRRDVRKMADAVGATTSSNSSLMLDYQSFRLAFRDVGPATNERSMIATILPRFVFCPHTVSLEQVYSCASLNGEIEPNRIALGSLPRLFLCGLLNSFVADFWLRRFITKHLSFYIVYNLPVPDIAIDDPRFEPVAKRVACLCDAGSAFDDLPLLAARDNAESCALRPNLRSQLRAELDGMIAHIYALTEEEFTHILTTFPLVAQHVKDAALEAYRNPPKDFPRSAMVGARPDAAGDDLRSLLGAGESARLEFKETLEADNTSGAKNPGVLMAALKTVAAFMNGKGGTLLIGVRDDGAVVGLAKDFALLGAGNADKLELKLRSLLKDRFVPMPFDLVHISFVSIDDELVCRVDVGESDTVIHLDGFIFLRDGNQTVKLEGLKLTQWLEARARRAVSSRAGGNSGAGSDHEESSRQHATPRSSISAGPETHDVASADNENDGANHDDASTSQSESRESTGPQQHTARRLASRSIGDYSTEELVIAVRALFSDIPETDRDGAIVMLCDELGFGRLGSKISAALDSAITVAVRRKVIYSERGIYRLACRSIDEYPRELLVETLVRAVGRTWTERDEAVKLAARQLGFARTGSLIKEEFKSAINSGLRRGVLEKDGTLIRRAR